MAGPPARDRRRVLTDGDGPIQSGMRSFSAAAVLAAALALAAPGQASAASFGAFIGFSPTGSFRVADGFSFTGHLALIGIELEYGHLGQDSGSHTPGATTAMANLQIATPGHFQVYVTGGAGLSHENLDAQHQWGGVLNLGGGIKSKIAGPIHLRIDYRVLMFYGTISGTSARQQRVYGGIEIGF